MKWFKHYAHSANDPRISQLKDSMGYLGLGIYWSIVEMIECYGDGTYPRTQLLALKNYHASRRRISEVLDNFGLFVTNEQNMVQMAPPPTRKIAVPAEGPHREKTAEKKASQVGDSLTAPSRPDDGAPAAPSKSVKPEKIVTILDKSTECTDNQFNKPDAKAGSLTCAGEEEREDKNRKKYSTSSAFLTRDEKQKAIEKQYSHTSWFPGIREILTNRSWQEVVCMQSNYGNLLFPYFAEAVEQFILHVIAYDTVQELANPSKAKYYFNSFIKPNSPTGIRLHHFLQELDVRKHEKEKENNPFRFELLVNGQRTADGQVIPRDAPPRPSPQHYWNEAQQTWKLSVYR